MLRIAHAYEQATAWHKQGPRLAPGAAAPEIKPPPILSVAEPADPELRDLCVKSLRRAKIRFDEQMLAQMLEGAPYALGMVKRLRRDHAAEHEPAHVCLPSNA